MSDIKINYDELSLENLISKEEADCSFANSIELEYANCYNYAESLVRSNAFNECGSFDNQVSFVDDELCMQSQIDLEEIF